MIISLTGFMGCGKSSIGRELSQLLSCPFMDLDREIEDRQGRSIPDIFSSDGEPAFRRMEHDELMAIINEHSSPSSAYIVLALGGGTVMTPECARMIHEHTYCIYLRASIDTLVKNLEGEAAGRPMLQAPSDSSASNTQALRTRIMQLMNLRESTYETAAHAIIDTDGESVSENAEKIRNLRF